MRSRCALLDQSEGRAKLNDEFFPTTWVIRIRIISGDEGKS